MTKTLPKDITAYDLIKTFAVVLMIVDHVGYYLYPEENWFRVIGRMCVPVWFFLIGYARSRDLGPKLWIGMLILLGGNALAGMSLVPLNILGTIIAVRLLIDPVMKGALRSEKHLWAVSVLLLFLIVPTISVAEYGTQAVVMAMFGFLIRHREETALSKKMVDRYFVFSFVSFVGIQSLMFGFDRVEFMALSAGVLIVMGGLYFFKPVTCPALTKALPWPFVKLLQFTGRRSLEIYVGHLLLIKGLGVFLYPERFVFLDWKLFSLTGL